MAKSKFFRIAVEGATSDGRVIDRTVLQDMAGSYDPAVYGARIFAEHIRGYAPDSPFKAYGDVVAVKAEEITDGPLKGKMALYAQIEPTPEMVALVKSKQKIYSSMEITPKFADTGRAYLSGLGITDSPASLGTEVLTFAAQHPDANPYASRKQAPGNLFTAAEEAVIEWEEEANDTGAKALFASIRDKLAHLGSKAKAGDSEFAEIRDTLTSMAEALGHFAERDTATTQRFADDFAAITTRLAAAEAIAKQQADDFAAFRAAIEAAPVGTPRPVASGGSGTAATNC